MHTIPANSGIHAGINHPVIPVQQVTISIPKKVIKLLFVIKYNPAAVMKIKTIAKR